MSKVQDDTSYTEGTTPNRPLYRIRDLPENDRPRERLAERGPGSLSVPELIAILLRTGVEGESALQMGNRLLSKFGGLRGLHSASFYELCQQRGLGEAKAAQLKAAIELGQRIAALPQETRRLIQSPEDAVNLVSYEMSALLHEELWILLADTRHGHMGTEKLYRGTLNSSNVRVAEVFKAAIQRNAACILVVHNHPSGDPTPSPEDIALTREIFQAGRLLDIELLDHIIIGDGRHVSLKGKGLGFG